MQDQRYRTVFAFPRMVEDLLRGFVLDARHVAVEDLPEPNLVTAVVRLERTRSRDSARRCAGTRR